MKQVSTVMLKNKELKEQINQIESDMEH